MEICLRSFPPTKLLPPNTRRGTSRHCTGAELVLGGGQFFLEHLYLRVRSQNLEVFRVQTLPGWTLQTSHGTDAVGGYGSVQSTIWWLEPKGYICYTSGRLQYTNLRTLKNGNQYERYIIVASLLHCIVFIYFASLHHTQIVRC